MIIDMKKGSQNIKYRIIKIDLVKKNENFKNKTQNILNQDIK